ncbi:MAG: DinB family protein [Panacibacter sp.]
MHNSACFSEANAALNPAPGKWSKKEILGHLIDSASNNHQRFVRMQIDSSITLPKYQQDEWVTIQQWQQREWKNIIDLWQLYNLHILHIFGCIDETKLSSEITLSNAVYTLQFIVDDYVDHLLHHLEQIFPKP